MPVKLCLPSGLKRMNSIEVHNVTKIFKVLHRERNARTANAAATVATIRATKPATA